ncbi:MAG: recombinase family protein, partial [Cyanobacteria bacterium J06659_2]
MRVVAYVYRDPLLEPAPTPNLWGWEVDRVYQDLGSVVAKEGAPRAIEDSLKSNGQSTRPQLAQLLQVCASDPPDYLLIRRLDGLGESLQQLSQTLVQLEEFGIVIIATEQDYRSTRLQSTAPAGPNQGDDLIRLLDEIQYRQRSRRIRQGHARNRVKTLPPPGKAPFGYRRGKDRYVIDRATAPLIREFVERFLLFGSLRGAVRFLEKKYSKKISVSTGQRWLTSPVYRG